MASAIERPPERALGGNPDYPTTDHRPMAETDLHRDMMFDVIAALRAYYAGQPAYVTGNLLVFYEPGNKRRHISPDCMVVKGILPVSHLNYLIWEQGRSPDVVIEITSLRTRSEDVKKKFDIYRTIMRVPEYFLFDPTGDYLKPRLQGYRLLDDQYAPIEPTDGRLYSEELKLYLQGEEIPNWREKLILFKLKRPAEQLRFFNPVTGEWLPTIAESLQIERQRAEEAELTSQQAEHAKQQAEHAKQQAEHAKQQADVENVRLKQELDELRRKLGSDPK
jgi:Uma2 family endonuclease